MAQSTPITSQNPNVCSAHRLIPPITLWSRTAFSLPFWIAHGTERTMEINWTSMKPLCSCILTFWPLCVCTKTRPYLPIVPSTRWPLTSNYMLQIKYNIQLILGCANYSAAATVALHPLRNPSGHSPSGTRHYCYVHRYATHKGHVCRIMLADSTTYTLAHLQAGSPFTPPDGSDKKV